MITTEVEMPKVKEAPLTYEEVLEGANGESLADSLKREITADKLLQFFSGIPEEEWCSGSYMNRNRQYCAIGHINHKVYPEVGVWLDPTQYKLPNWAAVLNYENGYGVRGWSAKITQDEEQDIATVNNGLHPAYRQSTPKARVLAFLEDAKAAGY